MSVVGRQQAEPRRARGSDSVRVQAEVTGDGAGLVRPGAPIPLSGRC